MYEVQSKMNQVKTGAQVNAHNWENQYVLILCAGLQKSAPVQKSICHVAKQ
jgi:hypothetical protein